MAELPRLCPWCGRKVESRRYKYCSEACAYGGQRAARKVRTMAARLGPKAQVYRKAES